VHARSVKQKYEGSSRWSFLKELVQSRPEAIIFGSGDIWCAEDIFRMMQQTGVHGVSVARGCIGNPWIFTQARALMKGEEPRDPIISEQRTAMLRHFELCTNLHGEQAASRMMRKFGIRFSQYHPNPKTVRKHFISVRSAKQWRDVLDTYYCVS
jgi:tRNA-dihydrouridine synthase